MVYGFLAAGHSMTRLNCRIADGRGRRERVRSGQRLRKTRWPHSAANQPFNQEIARHPHLCRLEIGTRRSVLAAGRQHPTPCVPVEPSDVQRRVTAWSSRSAQSLRGNSSLGLSNACPQASPKHRTPACKCRHRTILKINSHSAIVHECWLFLGARRSVQQRP